MHVAPCLNHEVQPEFGLAHLGVMPGFDNQLIDLIERCEETKMSDVDVRADVMVSQLMDAVVIAVETQAQYAKHQNSADPGTPKTGVRF